MRRENKANEMLKFCKYFLASIAKWKCLLLPLLLLLGCEAYKMPTDLGMPTWTTSLYLKIADKCYDIAKEISGKDSIFVLEEGKVTLKKNLDAKEIAFNSPKIEQTNSSKQEIGYFSVSNLGNCNIGFASSIVLESGETRSLPQSIQLNLNTTGFTKAELADAVVSLQCKNSSGEVVSGIDYRDLKLNVCDWDGNSKSLNFILEGKVSASVSDTTTWFTLKSSGASLSGNFVATANVTFDTLVLKIIPNSKNCILASKVELPANSNSFSGSKFSGNVKVGLGEDYELYQAEIATGKLIFSKKNDISGIDLTKIVISCNGLIKGNDTLSDSVFYSSNPTDSIIDLDGYLLGTGEKLDSLEFTYEIGYAAKSSSEISVKNTDAVEIGAKIQASFAWVKAKVKNASAFAMDSTNEKIDFGDDLPAFKTAKGADTTLSLAKNTKLTLGISLPATVESGDANLMQCNLTLIAYKGGVAKETIDTTKDISVGTTKGSESTIVVDLLEELINCSPDSITVKIVPKIATNNGGIFKFYCGDSIKTNIKLTSNLIFGEVSQIVYYQVEDNPQEQDCPLTKAQAESAKEIVAYLEYKNNTNTSLGAELLISKDSAYLRQNIYTNISDEKLRRIDLKDLEYNETDTSQIKPSEISMDTQDLLVLAGKDKEKVYTFLKVKVIGTGKELKGKFDVKVYVGMKVTVDEKLTEGNND